LSSTFGTICRLTTFGESHGPCIGMVLDGLESGLEVDLSFIRSLLARRRPSHSFETSRVEADELHIESGIKDGRTTGDPLCMLIENKAHDDKSCIKGFYRPGHGDYVYSQRFENANLLGGGRYSGRETAARVAAGAIAMLALKKKGIELSSALVQAGLETDPERFETAIDNARCNKDSIGGIILLRASGLPIGLGEPIFDKAEALLSHAIMSIGSVKAISFGDLDLSSALSNNQKASGGMVAGFTDGTELLARVTFKPTPSIAAEQNILFQDGTVQSMSLEGRFDAFLGYRIGCVIEAMAALSLLDMWYMRYGR
jgi:chorismate synthase